MQVVAVVHNSPIAGPGRLLPALRRAGMTIMDVQPRRGDPLPAPADVDAIVILGGEMGSYDEGTHPYLADEKETIREMVDEHVPLLGICLGAQLMADALGGKAMRSARPEVGLVELVKTDQGRDDPVIGPLEPLVLAVHQDTFELPGEATLLARSADFPHAFRLGSALGLQFHPEADVATVESWAAALPLFSESPGVAAAMLEELRGRDDTVHREAAGLFDRWLAAVRSSARSS